MDINSVITKEEYSSVKELDYEQACTYITKIVKLSVEESLKALPPVITHLASKAASLKELSDNFYKANKDLSKHRDVVTQVIERVQGENPGKSYKEILQDAAPKARSIISRLPRDSGESVNPRKNMEKFDSRLGKL